jgi:hypothetical protein
MDANVEADLAKAIQLTAVAMSLGVHPVKAAQGLCIRLKDLSQLGSVSREELRGMRAKLGSWTDEYANGWAEGYSEGWAAAIVRVLEQRDITVSDEIDGYLTTRTDLKALADWLDLAATTPKAEDLFADGRRST